VVLHHFMFSQNLFLNFSHFIVEHTTTEKIWHSITGWCESWWANEQWLAIFPTKWRAKDRSCLGVVRISQLTKKWCNKKNLDQVIQVVTFSSPNWRSLNPLKGSLNPPKKVTAWITRLDMFMVRPLGPVAYGKAVSTVSALLCIAAIGGLATMSTANAGCKFGASKA